MSCIGNTKPATVVKSEGAGSLFEKVEEAVQPSEQQQQQGSQTSAGSSSGSGGEKKSSGTDKIVISELDDSQGDQ